MKRRPPSPSGPPRRDRWQRVIDGLLGVSGHAAAPIAEGAARAWLEALSAPALSRLAERIADLPLPRPVLVPLIRAYVRLYDVDLRDAADELDAFATFNAFFTRALRPGARPIARDRDVIVSPADAQLRSAGPIDPRGRIPEVKGRRFSVAELLGDAREARRYRDGGYAVLYLSPRDYHRVHCPADAIVERLEPLAGRAYPVNALATRTIPSLLAVNKRLVFHLATEEFGPMALVMVGATNVGRITTTVTAGDRVSRGGELGAFNLGSTVVLLTSDPALAPVEALEGELVRVGQPLLRRT